jgi:hypothetical protein
MEYDQNPHKKRWPIRKPETHSAAKEPSWPWGEKNGSETVGLRGREKPYRQREAKEGLPTAAVRRRTERPLLLCTSEGKGG